MNCVFYNGTIITMDPARPRAEAVLVSGGRIRAVGRSREVLAQLPENTERVDLQGACLYPGFTDNHMHLLYNAQLRRRANLGLCRSRQEVLAFVEQEARRIREAGTDAWIVGVKFNQNHWEDCSRIPTRRELDEMTGDVPCFLLRCCEHVGIYNTRALELLGLLEERNGTEHSMGFYPDGTPDGLLYENDCCLGEEHLPQPTKEELRCWLREETRRYAALGLTAVHSDDLMMDPEDPMGLMELLRQAGETGELAIRIYEQCRLEEPEKIRRFAEKYSCGSEFGLLRTVSVKALLDGSLGAHSAYLLEGYANDPEAQNLALFTDAQVWELVNTANDCGYPVVVHAIGDGAVEQLVQACEAAAERHPGKSFRNGVNHCQIMRDAQLQRMARLGMLAYTQPVFIGTDAPIVDACVGETVAAQSYNWRRMWELGIHVSAGTDCPVELNDPIRNLYYAVTRDGGDGQAYRPENAMTVEQALRALTIEGAYAAGCEDRRGSIGEGKDADFVVLDRDLTAIDPWSIPDTRVLMTVVNGETVYRA